MNEGIGNVMQYIG